MVKSYFMETLLAQYNAVLSFPIPTLCYGYAGDRVFFCQADVSTTPSTPSSLSVSSILSKTSTVSSSPSKSHVNSPPIYTWVKDPYWWRLFSDDRDTGIAIDRITKLKISPHQAIKLNEPSYRIIFSPPDDERVYHLVEYSSLNKAKKIAEWYYQQWLKVNNEVKK